MRLRRRATPSSVMAADAVPAGSADVSVGGIEPILPCGSCASIAYNMQSMAHAAHLPVTSTSSAGEVRAAVRDWVEANVPTAWREAAARGGRGAIRNVRTRAQYESWYPTFAASGLVVATWPVAYGGLDL